VAGPRYDRPRSTRERRDPWASGSG
jgi:hypothetical protein